MFIMAGVFSYATSHNIPHFSSFYYICLKSHCQHSRRLFPYYPVLEKTGDSNYGAVMTTPMQIPCSGVRGSADATIPHTHIINIGRNLYFIIPYGIYFFDIPCCDSRTNRRNYPLPFSIRSSKMSYITIHEEVCYGNLLKSGE